MDAVQAFWAWWWGQLLDLVPGNAARRRSKAEDGLILAELAEGSVLVAERREAVEQSWGRIRLDTAGADRVRQTSARHRLPVVLRLPGAMLLEREVSLPVAAERDLGRVLFHEMDRYTPFAATEVVWTYAIAHRDRALGRLRVRLSLIQRAAAAPLLDALGAAGVGLQAIELAGPDGANRRIPLQAGPAADRPTRSLVRPLLLAACVLAVAVLVLPFILQNGARAQVERRIATAAPVVTRVQQLRRTLDATSTGSDVVAAERRRAGDTLEAIALLTDALPDDTYLTALTFDAGKLTLDGQSRSAAALIAPLTATQRLQDASFTAPVIRNTLGLDTFSMRLRVTR